ncbi:hypothetical protein [Escherichia coli]|uniref:hypothetical protein n=1 Tax=Escherichia coli TaxID=562 RepID=UPI0021C1ED43|nr:hypothetical protein [Escherichia coli]MCT8918758.1 hypothetical protein [Escherichia coli]HAW0505550.1 hypothetical protein [Escherichia coli]HAW4280151.1 hypothetical protein [Escherichia coli]HAW4293761.1 hypothetical protein [Escherichia coli]HBB9640803.1 hypothetical protein [Escherichia coli]
MNKKLINPEFKVYGDKNILDNMIINIEVYANSKSYPGFSVWKTETLLYNGKQYKIPENNDDIISYIVYYTYGPKVGMFKIDAQIARDAKGYNDVNAFYVYQKEEGVYFKYYARLSDITSDTPLAISDNTLQQEEYLKKYSAVIYGDHEQHLKNIFNLHRPESQSYHLYPYEKLDMAYYKKLSLAEKKKISMPEEYLRKMNLSEHELNELLQKSNHE